MKELEITLEAARVNAGLSKKEVAVQMKVTEAVVEGWESGGKDLTIRQARELSRLYGLGIDHIFFG